MWGPLILTGVVLVGVLCVKLPYSVTMSLDLGGYLWLSNSYTVTVAQLWEVFQIVYSSTGSYTGLICKMYGYLRRNEISLAE